MSTQRQSDVRVTLEDGVAVLEMDRPPANYFDERLIGDVVAAARQLDEDDRCRAVVLCSAGKHFCAGADFGEDGDFSGDRVAVSQRLYRRAVDLFRTAKPIIAAVQGAAVGGGLGLACAADFRVAERGTRFTANFARLGFHHGFGLTVTLPRIIGAQAAAALLYTGRQVKGEEALQLGLADRLAEAGEVRAVALALAREIADCAPLAVQSIRGSLRAGLADSVEAALGHELEEQSWLWRTSDCAEGISASLERRPATFTGS